MNDKRNGNWMRINRNDMSIIESGWYENDKYKGNMKNDEKLKNFTVDDIFIDNRQNSID